MGMSLGAVAGMGTSSHTAHAARVPRTPTLEDWKSLAQHVEGAVQLPSSEAYRRGKLLFSTEHDGARPAAVIRMVKQSDVQHAMDFAARFGLRVTARSGGHSYVGASAADGTIVLDQRSYDWVRYDAEAGHAQVWTGAGVYSVHEALAHYGRTIPTGTCPTVGTAGLTLGGGLGVESRQHGLTCDRLVRATAVTASGEAIAATSGSHADLFWALRGGGGGANVVVTSLTFATHAASSKGIFSLTFPSSRAAQVLTRWSSWMRDTDASRWANARVESLGGGKIQVRVLGVVNAGAEHGAARSLISAVGVHPTKASYRAMDHMDAVRYLGGGSSSPRQGFAAGSDVLASVSTGAATAIVGAVTARSQAGGGGTAILDPLGGAVSKPSTSATAFPWRDHAACVQWYANVSSSGGYDSARSWFTKAHQSLSSYSSGGYVNYLESGDGAERYFGDNLARLRSVRATYDPHHRIYSGLSI